MSFVSFLLPLLANQQSSTTGQISKRADGNCAERSVWELVWACLGTMFTCLWVALHPNVPGLGETGWRSFKKRLVTMFYAFLAPEVVVMWAMRQAVNARKIAMRFNLARGHPEPPPLTVWSVLWDIPAGFAEALRTWFHGQKRTPGLTIPKWTMTHGFFIQTGGFMLYKDSEPLYVLNYDELERLIDLGAIDTPTITEPEIQDKSKGDFLQKAFVTLQTVWFVIQCFVRWMTGLPLSKLEVVTLAFAALNWLTCAVWWYKPQNVQTPVALYLKPSFPVKDIMESGGGQPPEDKAQAPPLIVDASESPQEGEHKPPWVNRYLLKDYRRFSKYGFSGILWFIIYRIPYRLLSWILRPLEKMAGTNTLPPHATCIPVYYADKVSDREENIITSITLLTSTVFGAIHCIAWSYPFPSTSQLWLWRASCLVMAAMPVMMIVIASVSDGFDKYTGPETPKGFWYQARSVIVNVVGISLMFLFTPMIPAYIAARVVVLVLAVVSLWSSPPGTFQDVEWTKLIPHFR